MRSPFDLPPDAMDLVANRLGLAFEGPRQTDLARGLAEAAARAGAADPRAYVSRLRGLPDDSPDWRHVAAHLTVGETYFFREPATFRALEEAVLPSLIAARRADGSRRLRLWSAGCSTGEEPYSLAIALDRVLPRRAGWSITILATDVNAGALAHAARGHYRDWALRATPAAVRDRYFDRASDGTWRLDAALRSMVSFAPLTLGGEGAADGPPDTRSMDVILCRNVLMYFTPRAQQQTVRRLQHALAPGGTLVVSAVEAFPSLLEPLVPRSFPGAIIFEWQGPAPPAPDGGGRATAPPLTRPAGVPAGPTLRREEPITRARALANRGRLQEARSLCEARLVSDPLDAEAALLLAAVCQEQGDLTATRAALERTIYLEPHNAVAHHALGIILGRAGRPAGQRRCMQTVVQLLHGRPREHIVPASDGLTVGRLVESAETCLEARP